MNEKMNVYLSAKLKVLSFVSIVMVLYIHTYYTEGEDMVALGIMEKLVSRLCVIAVPLFYAISGYLFFLKMPKGINSIGGKLRKRVRTLLVPYLIANVLTFLFYVMLNFLIQVVPSIGAAVNFRILDVVAQGVWPTLRLLFIDPPVAFQLWFVRDLMLVMLFSPILYAVLRWISKTNLHWLALTLLLLSHVFIGYRMIMAVAWFSVGGLLAIHPKLMITYRAPRIFCYICLVVFVAFIVMNSFLTLPSSAARAIPVVGLPTVWLVYDQFTPPHRLAEVNSSWLLQRLCPYTFFIYLTHEPMLNILKKLPMLLSRNEWIFIVSYLCVPLMYVVVACVMGYLLKRYIPKAYYLYTGGR